MKITSAEFVSSAFDRAHWIAGELPEVAFLGRSNVGKSSLINSLLGRRGLARTSNTPGRTQSINFFLINAEFYFVDLPGYGYARVSKSMRADWGTMARDYLSDREQLVLCIQLIDARHPPTRLDLQLDEWLAEHRKPRVVVATKADKLSKNALARTIAEARSQLSSRDVMAFSSVTGQGRDELWQKITYSVTKT